MSVDLAKLKAKTEVLHEDYVKAKGEWMRVAAEIEGGWRPKNLGEYKVLVGLVSDAADKADRLIEVYEEFVEILWEREQLEPLGTD